MGAVSIPRIIRSAGPVWRRPGTAVALQCAKVALAIGLMAWVAYSVDLRRAFGMMSTLAPASVVVAIAALAAQSLLSAWRWSLVSAIAGPPLPLAPALNLFMVSLFYNQALPSTVPGDAARVVGAAKCGLGIGQATLGVILDRVLTLLGLLLLALVGQAVLKTAWQADIGIPFFFEATALSVVALLVLPCLGLLAPGLVGRVAGGRAAEVSRATARLLKRPRTPMLLGLTFVIHGFSILAAYALAEGMGLALGPAEIAMVLPAVLLVAQIPISVGGWGVREGGMVLALAAFGIGATDAATLSVVFGLAQLFWGLLGAIFILAPLRPVAAKQS